MKWLADSDIYMKRLPRTKHDFVGQRYGRLVANSPASHDSAGRMLVLCRCDCGADTIVRLDNMIEGRTLSCGCLKAEIRGKAAAQVHRGLLRLFPSSKKRLK